MKKRGVVIACAALALLIGVGALAACRWTDGAPNPSLAVAAPAADAPGGPRRMFILDGLRYVFLEDGARYALDEAQLGEVLGTLEYDLAADPQGNAERDGAATYALGGTVRRLNDYDPRFRVAVEGEDGVRIGQSVGHADGRALDLAQHVAEAQLVQRVESAQIRDHMGLESLRSVEQDDARALVECIAQATEAKMDEERYLAVARAQSEGRSYRVCLALDDGTHMELYLIPSMNLTLVGDGRYELAPDWAERCGALFDGLAQSPPPVQ